MVSLLRLMVVVQSALVILCITYIYWMHAGMESASQLDVGSDWIPRDSEADSNTETEGGSRSLDLPTGLQGDADQFQSTAMLKTGPRATEMGRSIVTSPSPSSELKAAPNPT